MITKNILGKLSATEFLQQYWQKKPLLIPQALPGFQSPLSPEELAGLACEEQVEARLVMEDRESSSWLLRHGPFSEEDFTTLPESHWTLLVQAVDHWADEVAELLDYFRFIPDWRLDDIMISYACNQGTVGPHFDYYDVFLLQASGCRLWKIGQHCDESSTLAINNELKILQDFHTTEEWTLQAGDILYLPPQVAHHGIALGDSMTISVGFRAPSVTDMIDGLADYLHQQLLSHSRYTDKDIQVARHPGEISLTDIQRVQNILSDHINRQDILSNWFGLYMTEPKYPELVDIPHEKINKNFLLKQLRSGIALLRSPGARFAFCNINTENIFFANGRRFAYTNTLQDFIDYLCGQRHYPITEITAQFNNTEAIGLALQLINNGCIEFDEDN